MASSVYVRDVGLVMDIDEMPLAVSVDHGTVLIGASWRFGGWKLSRERAEEFAQLYVRACWEAAADARALREEAVDVVIHSAACGAVCEGECDG